MPTKQELLNDAYRAVEYQIQLNKKLEKDIQEKVELIQLLNSMINATNKFRQERGDA